MKTHLGLGFALILILPSLILAADPPEEDAESSATDTNRFAARLAWHRKTLVDAYDTVGTNNPAWDAAAREALGEWAYLRAQPGNDAPRQKRITDALRRAAEADCTDPLIGYVSLKYLDPPTSKDPRGNARKASNAAVALGQSGYSDWIKFYGYLRAAQAYSNVYTIDTNAWNSFGNALYKARPHLAATLEEGLVPVEEAHIAANELLGTVKVSSRGYAEFYASLEPSLFKNYSNHHLPWVLKANYYLDYAWKARGNATADRVAESAWTLFGQRIAIAAQAAETAWKLNTQDVRIPLAALRIQVGHTRGREEMEMWFKRAMTIDPSSLTACLHKMHYLEPKWHGSPEAMIAFGRQCLVSKEYQGQVPLTLMNAHNRISKYYPVRDQYWPQPGVWKDIKASYETYLAAYPQAYRERAEYVLMAQKCEQWDEYVSLVKKLDPKTRDRVIAALGGEDEFNSLLNKAKEKASAGKN